MTDSQDIKSLNMRIAALTRSAREGGSSISAPARAAFLDTFKTRHECRFCGVIEIDQTLPEAERARRSAAAMKAHFSRLAQRSAAARHRAGVNERAALEAEAQLADELAVVDDAC